MVPLERDNLETFEKWHGIRQGCPLSPMLFHLGIETMADRWRQKKEVEGVKVASIEYKLVLMQILFFPGKSFRVAFSTGPIWWNIWL